MKHLKKEDGYVLVYVLIVFTILSFVAVSICNAALFNLKAQKADVARMEARYAAEGELQKFVAEVETLTKSVSVEAGTDITDDVKSAKEAAARKAFWEEVISSETVGFFTEDGEEPKTAEMAGNEEVIIITATRKNAANQYKATITAKAKIVVAAVFDDTESKATCTMENWQYTSYDISYQEVAG